jgi:glycosyltransferase involved in cell wall biosynthesis
MPNEDHSTPLRTAFVMEQALGHVTHFQNLSAFMAAQTDIVPTWLPIPFGTTGASRIVPLLRSNWSVRASWRARRALERTLATQPIDTLVFHTQVTSLFSHDMIRRIPTVISLDATPINYDTVAEYYAHRPAGQSFIDRQKYRLNRRVFHAAAKLVTWSAWAQRSLVDDYGVPEDRVHVLAPGAAAAYFEIGARRHAGDEMPAGDGHPVNILFVGGDFRRKGGPELLAYMQRSTSARCELHMVTQEVVEAPRNVHVHRELGPNSPALRQLFNEADIFVLPSRAECLAVALMEATAAGLPVITSDVAALPEAVRANESGLLIRPGDVASLATALDALVGSAQLRRRMGRAGYALARDKFDARVNNRALLDLVLEAAQTRPAWRRAA